jgi:polysaccharide biosynthesis protein PelG
MAGIGFELKKLIETRTLRGILGAAFSGTLVVAGPWLISTASMTAAQRLPILASPAVAFAFTGAMVWALALSICLSAAPLYIFVRLTSDLVYEGKRGEAATLLLKFAAASVLVSLPIGYAMGLVLAGSAADSGPMALAFALLLAAADTLWAATMTVTVVRKYGRVLASYVLGMGLMYGLSLVFGPGSGAAGALLALAAGYALTTLLLVASTVEALGTSPCPRAFGRLARYALKYRNLAVAGALYALATWADKAVLAAFGGSAAEGTRFYVNPGYDDAFFYSNLALIPGLVYYTIASETEFSLDLKRLVSSLGTKRRPEIAAAKARILGSSAENLLRQSIFQAVFAICLVLASPLIGGNLGFAPAVFARLLAGGIFQLVFLSALNMLFYLELYKRAAFSSLAFALLNVGLSLAACLSGRAAAFLGYPYLLACILSAALCAGLAFEGLGRFDRIVFLRATIQDFGK